MPRRYSDRRVEHEEFQKLLHIRMVQRLADKLVEESGETAPVSWENLERMYHTVVNETCQGNLIRNQIKQEVTERRAATTMKPVYGTSKEVRKEFMVAARKRRRPSIDPPKAGAGAESPRKRPKTSVLLQQLLEGEHVWFSTSRMKQAHCKLQGSGDPLCSPVCNGLRIINNADITWVGEAAAVAQSGMECCPICTKRASV
jgi:hypothetical protein